MKQTLIMLPLFFVTFTHPGPRRLVTPKNAKKGTHRYTDTAPSISPDHSSFVGLFQQLAKLERSTVHPKKSTIQRLQATQQEVQAKLRRILNTLASIKSEESAAAGAQLKTQLSSANAKFFDQLFSISSFIQSPAPDHTQALECLTLIKKMHAQGNTQCKEAQYLLCSAAFERSIIALQVGITYAEQRAETLHKRVALLERELATRKEEAEMVRRSTAALFELAPALFRKYNELARHVTRNEKRLSSLETAQPNFGDTPPSPPLSPLANPETATDSANDSDDFEVIEPHSMLP